MSAALNVQMDNDAPVDLISRTADEQRLVDLASLSEDAWRLWLDGYGSGYRAGLERGRQLQDDELGALQRAAAAVVHRAAGLPDLGHDLSVEGAARREAASIAAFRADHARRRGQAGDRA
ncbi:hypothetical protein FB554_2545 [Barrientosiimonas humi]|uniref:Uncharacterized protein n=1 Tax=Barrientosiimonas humi TaxID=999931 RepID=A0A542XF01_9MICO|nr:hypothetical protein [Barrientosiimonas humi]TQL34376.1 hypothetical protein FB554_2545 [Barrientosiimonas humi]CAG7574366.1 hypothetical protein BH39T_PBIAJDOK_03016 [Barrientosiimonas humi]